MVWVRLADDFTDHPKVVAAGPLAGWLYVCGLTYANRYLTDGFIPSGQVRRMADVEDSQALAQRLVDNGLWEPVEGGYRIHDYHGYQPTAEAVKREREETAKRQADFRARKAAKSNGQSNAVTNGPVTGAPARPVPGPYPVPEPGQDPAVTTPQPPPQAEGERQKGDEGGDEPTVEDTALLGSAKERLRSDLKGPNWERFIAPLEAIGRGGNGGLLVRAPPGATKFRRHIAAALAAAGDSSGFQVAIVE